MKKVLLTTSAIVGLSVPAFAADPTAVSDQPYFHHSHPMTWSGSMSISLTNLFKKMQMMQLLKVERKTLYSETYSTLLAGTNGEEEVVGALFGNDTLIKRMLQQLLVTASHAIYTSTQIVLHI